MLDPDLDPDASADDVHTHVQASGAGVVEPPFNRIGDYDNVPPTFRFCRALPSDPSTVRDVAAATVVGASSPSTARALRAVARAWRAR